MKIAQSKYIEWLDADEMHEASKNWLSELNFIKDEHQFFEDLITSFTMQILEPQKFSKNKEIIDALNRSQKHNNVLIEAIKIHENELQVMVDEIDQLEKEKAYTKEHRDLLIVTTDFLKEYRALKIQLFDIIKSIKKEEKNRRLLDRK
jgi:hypothetical protein